MVSSPSKE